MRILAVGLLLLTSLPLCAQLTQDQKKADFLDTVALYTKHYAPYEWKRDAIGFDLRNVQPWLDRIAATNNDLDFFEVMVESVASLQDSHDHYTLPSNFSATLNLGVDLYDGKAYVDSTNRTRLPQAQYPFAIGDEVVSVDGVDIQDLIPQYGKYVQQANPRSNARGALSAIFTRSQASNPYATGVDKTSAVVFRKADGTLLTLNLPWFTSGLPLTTIDPVESLNFSSSRRTAKPQSVSSSDDLLKALQTSMATEMSGIIGTGALSSVFSLPVGFKYRLGTKTGEYFTSGTFTSGPYTLGFIRIPTYSPADTVTALAQFATEMAYFQQNVDGLLVDQMRNPGGDLCYGENIASYLMPDTFRPLGYEIRATREYLQLYFARLQSVIAAGSSQEVIDQYQGLYNSVLAAYTSNSPRTDAVPLCSPSFARSVPKDSKGNLLSYRKPLVFLIDEFSSSTADSVPAVLQDNSRGLLVGYRTNGAGGSNALNTSQWNAGAYSEGTVGITLSLMVRKDAITTAEYGTSKYIENVGVRPDVVVDYMTRENLLNGGKTFLNTVTDLLVQQIQGIKPATAPAQ